MYTRRGDTGETSLYGSRRVGKDSPLVEAYGTVDELNSIIGLALSVCKRRSISVSLRDIQRTLFVVGADLASGPESKDIPRITEEDTAELERMTDRLLSELPRLTNFVLPGGTRLAAELHLARAVCRRAERKVVTAAKVEKVNPAIIPYLNRLSTYLFNLARYANMLSKKKEEVWSRHV